MTITLLQQDIAWGAPTANHKMAEEAILAAPTSDLYVLPEMWSTGFATEPEGIAETSLASLHWMQRMATRMNAAIAGSIATQEGEGPETRFYNRFYFVKPGEEDVVHYDKHHLFTYGNEHLRYSAGNSRVVVEWRGVRFLLQVCYDLRFPVFARNSAEGSEAYDVALYVASWPMSRRLAWDTLLRARAIENQCYVCAVNRTGNDPACHYNGGTTVIDAYGKPLATCPDAEVASLTVTLDMERLQAFRQKFPVLKDKD